MTAIKEYEKALSARLISGLQQIKGLKIWGITDLARTGRRVPTVSFTLEGLSHARSQNTWVSAASLCGMATIMRWQ
jgi:selenocysteine lyase/cysteine desulfurase